MDAFAESLTIEALFVRVRRETARVARRTFLQLIYPERFVEPCEAAKAETNRAPGGQAQWLIVDEATGEVLGTVAADEAAARACLCGVMKRPVYGGPEGVRDAS